MSKGQKENNEIILYTSPEGKKKIKVVFQNENFWLTQKAMGAFWGAAACHNQAS